MKAKYLSLAAALTCAQAFAADVGISVSIGQPGFYGQIDIGHAPRPQLIYAEPVIVERVVHEERPPLYLYVPPGHAKHWERHCHEYHACGERVYFVDEDWYNTVYAPRYRERHEERERYYEDRDDERDEHYQERRERPREVYEERYERQPEARDERYPQAEYRTPPENRGRNNSKGGKGKHKRKNKDEDDD